MDRTLNKFIIVFVCLVVFDTLTLDISFSKSQWGILSGVTRTISTTLSFVKAVR